MGQAMQLGKAEISAGPRPIGRSHCDGRVTSHICQVAISDRAAVLEGSKGPKPAKDARRVPCAEYSALCDKGTVTSCQRLDIVIDIILDILESWWWSGLVDACRA